MLEKLNNELIRYGKILSKTDICDRDCVTIRIIEYDNEVYVSHMKNGYTVKIEKLKG